MALNAFSTTRQRYHRNPMFLLAVLIQLCCHCSLALFTPHLRTRASYSPQVGSCVLVPMVEGAEQKSLIILNVIQGPNVVSKDGIGLIDQTRVKLCPYDSAGCSGLLCKNRDVLQCGD
jgi:hypothetical protein